MNALTPEQIELVRSLGFEFEGGWRRELDPVLYESARHHPWPWKNIWIHPKKLLPMIESLGIGTFWAYQSIFELHGEPAAVAFWKSVGGFIDE